MAATKRVMPNVEQAFRPELMAWANKELGHAYGFLQRKTLKELRDMCRAGDVFDKPAAEAAAVEIALPDTPTAADVNPIVAAILPDIERTMLPKIAAVVNSEVRRLTVKTTELTVKTPTKTATVDLGMTHRQFDLLLAATRCDRGHAWLAGPAGSGKTTAIMQLAKALGPVFGRDDYKAFCMSASAAMQPYELFGYVRPTDGVYMETDFYRAVKDGHLFLLDEGDATPTLLIQINMLLDNGVAAFPTGRVDVHPHFRCVIGGNTFGTGATAEYTGRVRQDKATLTRFAMIPWGYDEGLEKAVAGDDEWVGFVQRVRRAVEGMGASRPSDIIVTPRASVKGAEFRRVNGKTRLTVEQLADVFVWPMLTMDDRAKVVKAMKGK